MLILNVINSLMEVAVFLSWRVFFTVNLLPRLTFNQDSGFKERVLLKVGRRANDKHNGECVAAPRGGGGTDHRREC